MSRSVPHRRLPVSVSRIFMMVVGGHHCGVLVFACFLNLLHLSAAHPAGGGQIVHRYREVTGGVISEMVWRKTPGHPTVIRVDSAGKHFQNVCDPQGNTLSWRMEEDNRLIAASRQGDTLVVRGTVDGYPYNRTFPIDGAPWYQALSFSLSGLALNTHLSGQEFWMIRPDTLEAVKLRAEINGEEQLPGGGQDIDSVRVEVRSSGLFSLFWSGIYWFEAANGDFLQYKSRHGGPGTAVTIIQRIH